VYCHAVTFYAYALYLNRRSEDAFRMLRRLLVGHPKNPLARAGQLPLYVPNFFTGPACGPAAYRSSHSPNTGTASWYYRTAIAMLLGVRAEFDGLRLDPQLPAAWKTARVWREWRGAEFDIRISRVPGTEGVVVRLDGEELADNLIPRQDEGSWHKVEVTVG
jgi:cellobionic acid phosphorylase